jgi:hypothetical protein
VALAPKAANNRPRAVAVTRISITTRFVCSMQHADAIIRQMVASGQVSRSVLEAGLQLSRSAAVPPGDSPAHRLRKSFQFKHLRCTFVFNIHHIRVLLKMNLLMFLKTIIYGRLYK